MILLDYFWGSVSELAYIQRGEDGDELHYFLRFVCRSCGESLFQFDPD